MKQLASNIATQALAMAPGPAPGPTTAVAAPETVSLDHTKKPEGTIDYFFLLDSIATFSYAVASHNT